MSFRRVNSLLLACCGAGALFTATLDANAGGFALREQSAFGQGSSFAGIAAGGSLSSMFWNPATMTQVPGLQIEASASAILPYATHTPTAGSSLLAVGFGGTNDTADNALVPSAYASWQLNPNMWLGISVNSPFGLSVGFPNVWAGRDYAARSSSLKTYNATPSFAYRINDWLSVGVGVQIQYAKASLGQGITAFPLLLDKNLSGDGWGYGFTAGITLTPTPTTTIGIGYRSAINQKIEGQAFATILLPPTDVQTTINLPDMISLGLRQRVGQQLTLLGTVEWSNWSRIGTSNVYRTSGAFLEALPFQFQDGWFFSVGAEYQWTDRLAVRGGIGFERSPITDQVREPALPDNDRLWLSLGASYHISKDLVADLAYSHLFVKSTHIDISAASGNPWFNPAVPIAYIGDVSSHVDIFSLSLKYRFDSAAPAPKTKLVTK